MADASAIALVRSYIGDSDPPSDVTIGGRLDAGESAASVALGYLQGRRANLVASPLKWQAGDDYSQDATANLKALDVDIARLLDQVSEENTSTDSTIQVTRLVRPNRRR